MKQFMDKNFLLSTPTAQKLYHEYAENMPIIDYHCHLDPKEIYEDRQFENITQVWLGGDHYKWRQMRSNGVEEKYIGSRKIPKVGRNIGNGDWQPFISLVSFRA